MKRAARGYGFSLTGSSPVCVRRVEEGSSAWQAGLRVDDAVIRINGQNVSKSIADSVAKIVRQSEKQIIMDIHRETSEVKGEGQDAMSSPTHSGVILREEKRQTPPSCDTSSADLSSDISSDLFIDIGEWEPPRLHKSNSPVQINFQELSEEEQNQQTAIQELIHLEQDFIKQMEFGLQRYSKPLRHKFVSPTEHSTLFQNMEKLISISEYHVHKLHEDSISYSDVKDEGIMFTESIGSTYVLKVGTN